MTIFFIHVSILSVLTNGTIDFLQLPKSCKFKVDYILFFLVLKGHNGPMINSSFSILSSANIFRLLCLYWKVLLNLACLLLLYKVYWLHKIYTFNIFLSDMLYEKWFSVNFELVLFWNYTKVEIICFINKFHNVYLHA